MPVCSHCQQERSLRDYYFVTVKSRRYRRRKCKRCHQQTAQAWKREHAEHVTTYNREYYQQNAEYIRPLARKTFQARYYRRKYEALVKVIQAQMQ